MSNEVITPTEAGAIRLAELLAEAYAEIEALKTKIKRGYKGDPWN